MITKALLSVLILVSINSLLVAGDCRMYAQTGHAPAVSYTPAYTDYQNHIDYYPLAVGDTITFYMDGPGCMSPFNWYLDSVFLSSNWEIDVTTVGNYYTTGFVQKRFVVYPIDSPLSKYTGIPPMADEQFDWWLSVLNPNSVVVYSNKPHGAKLNYAILNVNGQQQSSGEIETSVQYSNPIDISKLSAGIYFIIVDRNGSRSTKKFVKY